MSYFVERRMAAPSTTMKRCLDWIRCQEHPLYGDILLAGYTEATISALWNRGFVRGVPGTYNSDDVRLTEYSLTHAGHSYLNKIQLEIVLLRQCRA